MTLAEVVSRVTVDELWDGAVYEYVPVTNLLGETMFYSEPAGIITDIKWLLSLATR